MNEYMLIYQGGDPKWMEGVTKEELEAAMEQWGAWMGGLQANDQLVSGGSPLHYSGKTISSDKVVTDISAAELKEIVSGYSIIKAASMDDAIAIAKQCPIFNHPITGVQVREVMQMA